MRCTLPSLVLVGLVAAAPAHAQDPSAVEIRTQPVVPGVYMLIGSGGNIGVSVGEDGVFLIDDQYAPMTDEIVAALGRITSDPVRFVFNTHWHQDHTGGNENLGGRGALIVAHENVRVRMSVDQVLEFAGRSASFPASPAGALPVVTFAEDITFHLNGDELHAFHVENAHTDGDAIVYFRRSNVVHMGDTFIRGMFPYIDTATGGSIDGMIAAVDAALQVVDQDTKVIPGHGALATQADLVAYGDALRSMRRSIAELVLEGHPLDHILEFRPIQAQAEALGVTREAEDDFVATIYKGVTTP
jgi:glyoxylase-like metal-dependent hydrolase (beta-lactamase superfamily II)